MYIHRQENILSINIAETETNMLYDNITSTVKQRTVVCYY